ncbi:MAG: hypothetical protein OEV93_00015 [Candidatus Moranbacteria bacterium]|nr:hypothetical protein [Candidatus Moranbacteria bacterium]
MGKVLERQRVRKTKLSVNSIIALTLALSSIAIIGNLIYEKNKSFQEAEECDQELQEKIKEDFEENAVTDIQTIQSQINMDDWKNYQTSWYGFKIQYPSTWKNPVPRSADRYSLAEYYYEFRSPLDNPGLYSGFDVVVYNVSKVEELSNTNEFPKLKDPETTESTCQTLDGHLLETGEYPAEEIYIPSINRCYNPVLFFSVTKGDYIFNIVPKTKANVEPSGDPMKEISDSIPEFFAAISTFENIDIVRVAKRSTATIKSPRPVSYKLDSLGRFVCEKKNDKPGKSKKGKGKHLDMECCLDPDEYANPHCYYDPEKYGKYL